MANLFRKEGQTQVVDAQGNLQNFSGNLDTLPIYNSNAITVDSLKPQTPLKLDGTIQTPTDTGSGLVASGDMIQSNIQKYLDAANQPQSETQSLYDQLLGSVSTASEGLTGRGSAQLQAEQQTGATQANKELADLNAQYLSRKAEYDKLITGIEAGAGRQGLTTGAVMGQQGAVARAAASELGLLQAQILGKQGQVEQAQNAANRAVDLMYADREAVYNTKLNQYNLIKDKLTTEEAKKAKAIEYALGIEKVQNDDLKEARKDTISKIFDLIKDGKVTSEAGFKAMSDFTSGRTSISESLATLGITGSGNPGIVGGYNISKYATDPEHEVKVASIYNRLPEFTDTKTIDQTIKSQYTNSPITGSMIMNAANQFNVDPKMIFAIMAQDSSMGTAGIGAKNFNPGNIGQFDSLGTTPTKGYKSWQEGVNAVGKWLSNNKATGIYNGEFGATLESAVSGEPVKLQESTLKTLQNKIASKDYASAYQLMGNSVSKALTGENKTRYDSARIDVNILSNLQNVLKQYEDAGGDMNFLKGTTEQIQRKFGALKKDPKFASIAVQLEREFQAYRNQMTGAAFGPGESREYESVNPTGKKSFALNYAVINGAVNQLNNRIDSTVQSIAGDGAKAIKEYSEFQGLSQPQILIKLASKNSNIKAYIDSEKARGTPMDVVIEALGYKNLIQ